MMRNVRPTFGLTLTWLMPGQVDFRRILGRRDIAIFGVEYIEARVQRNRLTGTRWARDEDHAVRLGQVLLIEYALVRPS